jgi:uncharacterized membrane protein
MDQNDPEKRIADLERQLGEQRRGAELPPLAPHPPQAGPLSNSDPTGRRFVVRAVSKAWARYCVIGFMFLALGVFVKFFSTKFQSSSHGMVMLLVFCVIFSLVGRWVFVGRKVVIRVTTDGLTVSKRPGDVFSFRDAELGQCGSGRWTRGGPHVGRALFLTSGPHRFVLADAGNVQSASEVPIEGPQVTYRDIDAWTRSTAFDELLAIVGAKRGPQHDPADLQLAQPAQQADAGPESGGGSRKVAFLVRFFAMGCLVAGVNIFGTGAILVYQDSLGTGTTATIDHCVPHVYQESDNGVARQGVDYETCYAKWSTGGLSQTGPIRGRFHGDRLVGSQVDVHVRGGTAYERQASSAQEDIWRTFGGFVAIATGVVLFWSARRKIRTARWPWSRPAVV